MDLSGRGADVDLEQLKIITRDTLIIAPRKRLADGGPDSGDEVKLGQLESPITDQWTYHAVANVILAHSLIRSFKEVDSNRTAIEGISWGGYVTLIAASLDNRFKAAVNEFGSGFLHENSYWKEWFDKRMTTEQRDRWVKLWDPSMYVGSAVVPILFHTGTTDPYYPFDSFTKTYQLAKGPRNLCILPDLAHESYYKWLNSVPTEVALFIDQHLKGGTPLPMFTKVSIADGYVFAEVESKTKLKEACISYTTDTGPMINRLWRLMPAKIEGNSTISATVPAGATIWEISVIDVRHALVSSEPVFAENGS